MFLITAATVTLPAFLGHAPLHLLSVWLRCFKHNAGPRKAHLCGFNKQETNTLSVKAFSWDQGSQTARKPLHPGTLQWGSTVLPSYTL